MAQLPRRPQPPWLQSMLGRLTPAVRVVIVLQTAALILYVFVWPAQAPIARHLFIGPSFFGGELWQPFAALAFPGHPYAWLFPVLGLWWIGTLIESTRGRRYFLAVLLGAGVAANLVMLAFWLVLPAYAHARGDGLGFAATGIYVAFARIYRARPVSLIGTAMVRADYLTAAFVGFGVVMMLFDRDLQGVAGTLAAIAVGLAATAQRRARPARERRGQVIRLN